MAGDSYNNWWPVNAPTKKKLERCYYCRETGEMCFLSGEKINVLPVNLISTPPEDNYKVTNIYVNKKTGKLVVEYNNEL